MSLTALSIHTSVQSFGNSGVFGKYVTPSSLPQLVYPVKMFNKEPVKKATVVEYSLSVVQSGWIMVLIINYWGGVGGKKCWHKLKAKPEFIRYIINME